MKNISLPAVILMIGLLSPAIEASTQTSNLIFLQLSQASNQKSLDQAVHEIKQQTGGRILSAKTVAKAGKQIHVIKVLLPSGKVRIFKVNAR